MKLRQFQCLAAVVNAGFNISRAAIVLNATQPAISKQLRQLEEELSADLLLRQGGRPVALTEVGERTLLWARRALQCADNIRALTRGGPGSSGTIAVATSHAHAKYVLLPAITAFSRRFPETRITVLQGTPDEVAGLVRDGKAPIGIAHLPEELPKEIIAVPFLTSSRVLVVPAGHPLSRAKKLTLERLADFPLIVQASLRPGGPRVLRKFHLAGVAVNVAVQAFDPDVIKAYVMAGLGVGVIPAFSYSAREHRQLRMRDVGHLFDASESAVLLRRHSHIQSHVYQFLAEIDPVLEPRRLEALVMQQP